MKEKKEENQLENLIKLCKPIAAKKEIELVERAYNFAKEVYKNTSTDYGETYLSHVYQIARVANKDIGLGAKSIAGALLHAILLETNIKKEEINKKFGPTILAIVDSYARISRMPTDKITLQSDKFIQLFLTLVDDIRVILLKLSHRLYDMRIIEKLPKKSQKKFSEEVAHLYIPVAHRLGLYKVKTELEDLLMRHQHPDIYSSIEEALRITKTKRKLFVSEFINPIERELIKQGFEFDIKGRPKLIPSIWDKMKRQEVGIEEVYDLFAIRIIVNSKPENEKSDCWKIYSIITNTYLPNPKRLRDWISTPKASGYESLHTTVKGPKGKWVEVQIRTDKMNEIAEKGQAAHWRYKGFDEKELTEEWLNQVRDILEHPEQIKFNQTPKKNKTADKIFVFTPTGDLKELPLEATVLDFAYEIHTRIGDQCSGAKVNNAIVPIRHVLQNGDKVEIITSKNQKPKLDWLKYVNTSKAKNKIKRTLKEQEYQQAEIGLDILKRKLKNWRINYGDEIISLLVQHYKFSSSIELYYLIAEEKIDLIEIKKILQKKKSAEKTADKNKKQPAGRKIDPDNNRQIQGPDQDVFIIDNKLDNVNCRFAKCCSPIPGDPVFGFVTIGKGITIHRKRCPNAKRLLENYGYRKISVGWKKGVTKDQVE